MIREVKREDIPICVDLIKKSFMTVADELGLTPENAPGFTAFAVTSERLYHQMDHENRQMYVYQENGVLCGYYSLFMQHSEAWLNHLAVLPAYRHNGIGQALLNHAFDRAQKAGCTVVYIDIVEENTVLRKWYEDNGAIHVGLKEYDSFPFTVGNMKKVL